jgi:hypothetical protein
VSAVDLALHGLGWENLDLRLGHGVDSRLAEIQVRFPGVALGVTAVDDFGLVDGGRRVTIESSAGELLHVDGDAELSSTSAGLFDYAWRLASVWQASGVLWGALPYAVHASAAGHWTGPYFYGGSRDVEGYSLAADARGEDTATVYWERDWRRSDVLDSPAVKGRVVVTSRYGLLARGPAGVSGRYERSIVEREWEISPIEDGWLERLESDERTAWDLSVEGERFGVAFRYGESTFSQDGVRDDDGDGVFDEDEVDGLDNDGDGVTDEDAANHDLHTLTDMEALVSYDWDRTQVELRWEEGTTRTGVGAVVDASSQVGLSVACQVSDALGVSVGGAVHEGGWEQRISLTCSVPSSGFEATAFVRIASEQPISGSHFGNASVGIEFERRFSLPVPIKLKGQAEGVVFLDKNQNGIADADEPGVGGAIVGLGSARARSNDAGLYRFPAAEPGMYRLAVVELPGHLRTSWPGGDVSIAAGEVVRVAPIPVTQAHDLTGLVFDDRDGNGQWDSGELGIPNARLELRGLATDRSTWTSSDGRFAFTDLQPGAVVVWIDVTTLPERFNLTTGESMSASLPGDAPLLLTFGAREALRPVVTTYRNAQITFGVEQVLSGENLARRFTAETGDALFDEGREFRWDFDGDGVPDATGAVVEFSFPQPGRYVVTLTVQASTGTEERVAKILDIR